MKSPFAALALALAVAVSVSPRASASSAPTGLDALKPLSYAELASVFAHGLADRVPDGDGKGLGILVPQAGPLNDFASQVWTGKVLSKAAGTEQGVLMNKVLGGRIIRAKFYKGELADELKLPGGTVPGIEPFTPSIAVDGKPSIILNYSVSEIGAARTVVDEIRRVMTDRYETLYLGRATVSGHFWCYFALEFAPN